MATATEAPSATRIEPGELRFVIDHLGWEGYETLLEILGDDGPRVYYSGGRVELMSPHQAHESYTATLGQMVKVICEKLEIPIRTLRSTTLRRRDVEGGAEPDESIYLANFARIRYRTQIDLNIDPPPDLAIEVEITNGLLEKLEIYARLGIPELWRFDGEQLTVELLGPEGTYRVSETSASFPFLPMAEIVRFLKESPTADESQWARRFRTWVREVLGPIYQNRV